MSTNAYITLASNDGVLSKRFKVLFEEDSYAKVLLRQRNLRTTANGKLDIQHGAHFQVWSMILRVDYQVSDAAYGTLDNLETLANYNVPPGDELTFTDHLGGSHTIYLDADLEELLQTPMLDGVDAFYLVPVILRETTSVS